MLHVEIKNCNFKWQGKDKLFSIDSLEYQFDNDKRVLPIMGRSGLGKSTLLYLMSGLKLLPRNASVMWSTITESSGEKTAFISLNDKSLIHEVCYLQEFSYAFQNAALLPYLTIEENFHFCLEKSGKNKSEKSTISSNVLEKIFPSDFEIIKDSYPNTLSGGEYARAALGRCMLTSPKVIFADEPTGMLDPETRKDVLVTIKSWLEENKSSVFIWVTHQPDEPSFMGAKDCLICEDGTFNIKSVKK